MKKIYIFKLLSFLILFVVTLFFLEIFLRLSGVKPWSSNPNKEKSIFLYNSKLGWKAKKGTYQMLPNKITGGETKITINEKGDRFSGKKNIDKKSEKVIFVGGSFTQGWGLNDLETYPAKFQKKYNNFRVYNYGQAGYGSTQSLLLLEQEIKNIQSSKLIIYGFMDHHLERNVARGEWLGVLLKYSNNGFDQKPKVPYATIDKNKNLKIHPPIGYITLPFREISSLVTTIEKIYMKQTTRHRKKIQQEVLNKIISRMSKISKSLDSNFIVVNLSSNDKASDIVLRNYLNKNKINYVDCRIELKDKYLVPGEHHPSKKAHTFYNNCLIDYILKEKILLF